MAKDLHFGPTFQKVPGGLRFVAQLHFNKPQVFLRESRFFPGSPSKQVILVQSFSNCCVIKLNILHAKQDLKSLKYSFFFCCISLSPSMV